MRKFFLSVAVSFLLCPLKGRAEEVTLRPIEGRSDILIVKDGWKFGLKKDNGSVIVPCEYEEILSIEGATSHFILALGGKYGVVDEYGTMLLPVRYSYIVPKLYGNKLLIQKGGTIISETSNNLSIRNNDPYHLQIGSGNKETAVRYLEINPLEWIPYARRFTTNGQWGLADIRPNVSMINPSYSMVRVCPDNDRYVLMGYSFGNVSAYNIYDTKKESFLLSMEKKVQYSSIYLLEGGYFLVNGLLRKLSEPEINISSANYGYIIDFNKDYFLGQIGKTVVLVEKKSGKAVAEDRNITHYINNSKTGDFFLKENGLWVLYSDGKRYGCFSGTVNFKGGYPLNINGGEEAIIIDGKAEHKTLIDRFVVSEDGKSIVYINSGGTLVMLEYPSKTEKPLQEGCSTFEIYYSNCNYVVAKKKQGDEQKAGMVDLSGKTIVPFEFSDIKPLYGDYYFAESKDWKGLRRINDTTFKLSANVMLYNYYTRKPFCWVSNSGESNSYALFSMEKDTLLTDYAYSGVVMSKYPGRIMMLGNDYIPFMQNSKIGIMDIEGKKIFNASYGGLLFNFTEGFCIVMNDSKYGSVNPYTGVVLPCEYENLDRFVQGNCFVKKNGFWGVADKNGVITVPTKYKDIADFFEDLDWLRKNNFSNGLTYGVLDDKATPAVVEWFDASGKALCTGTAAVPQVQSVIPEGLWDY